MAQPKHILIVDDEPNIRLVFRTTLESGGYRVAEAGSGEEGLKQLRTFPADLVLLDLLMPGLSGMTILERLRAANEPVPVVMITAHGSIPDAVSAMKLGAIDFLSKPIKPEALRDMVSEVLRRHIPMAPAQATVGGAGLRSVAAALGAPAPTGVDLAWVKRALNQRDFGLAHERLEQVLELDPNSVAAHHLMGVLRESLGQDRAAYEAYRIALETDPHHGPALESMRRYCARVGLDFNNWSINPGAE